MMLSHCSVNPVGGVSAALPVQSKPVHTSIVLSDVGVMPDTEVVWPELAELTDETSTGEPVAAAPRIDMMPPWVVVVVWVKV